MANWKVEGLYVAQSPNVPSDGEMYSWDEAAGNWVAVPKE